AVSGFEGADATEVSSVRVQDVELDRSRGHASQREPTLAIGDCREIHVRSRLFWQPIALLRPVIDGPRARDSQSVSGERRPRARDQETMESSIRMQDDFDLAAIARLEFDYCRSTSLRSRVESVPVGNLLNEVTVSVP